MSPWQIRQAVRLLRGGGLIAYPTETVYGLGCDPLNRATVERLLHLKQRPVEKGLILVAASLAQLLPYLDLSDSALLEKLLQPTPRPTTWVAPSSRSTPRWLTGNHDTIAVRLSRRPEVQALCSAFGGALVSTSANPAGLPPARSATKVKRYFGSEIDYLLSATIAASAKPSEIRDLISDEILRPA